MTTTYEFQDWGKTSRFEGNFPITITEKLDGTNACVAIEETAEGRKIVGVQSRNRVIDRHSDNAGFANWAYDNEQELLKLGVGRHFGEWAGPGIQKNPHNLDRKTFFLFNFWRPMDFLPEGVKIVPVLYQGDYQGALHVDDVMKALRITAASKGYTPEGIVIYFHQTRSRLKYTFHYNQPKWALAA